jgi:LAGLIDADG endonuclease
VSSDNPFGAVNQQERPSPATWLDAIPHDVGHYIAGFVDGEGSFNVPIRRSRDRGLPFRVSLSFNVSQFGAEAPRLLHTIFGVGTTRARGDGVWYFEVTQPEQLEARVFPFFERFPLRLSKASDLAVFRRITTMVRTGRHLSVDGFIEVLALRAPMNRGGKRRRTDEELIEALRNWESSEAIRKAPRLKPGDEDMVHAP